MRPEWARTNDKIKPLSAQNKSKANYTSIHEQHPEEQIQVEVHATSPAIQSPSLERRDSFGRSLGTDKEKNRVRPALTIKCTPSSSPSEASKSSYVFTDEEWSTDGQTDSEYDARYDDDDSGNDSVSVTSEVELKSAMVQILDSCIFAACGHDLPIAARLILLIHASAQKWNEDGYSAYITTAGGKSEGTPASAESGNASTSASSHRQMQNACERQSSALKEGIDDGQWEKIKHVLKKTTNRGRQDFDKWFDIWKILFPDTTAPLTPWNEPETSSLNPAPNTEFIMREIRSGVENSIEQGLLPRDEQLYQHVFTIVQRALETQSDTSASPITTSATIRLRQNQSPNASSGEIIAYETPLVAVRLDGTDQQANSSYIFQEEEAQARQTDTSNLSVEMTTTRNHTVEYSRPGLTPLHQDSLPVSSENSIESGSIASQIIQRSLSFNSGIIENPPFAVQGSGFEDELETESSFYDQYLDIDGSLPWNIPTFEASEEQGEAYGNNESLEICESPIMDEGITDFSAILEPELQRLDPTEKLTREGRNKAMKRARRLDFGDEAII
ncbi:hypothetical protein EG329_011191 [Mollisiaceae sp. DMI_Dod_QoI]|nr:hypothetical protein EG329_011191 [Helotiales sp. DMI_Dod_QoI]